MSMIGAQIRKKFMSQMKSASPQSVKKSQQSPLKSNLTAKWDIIKPWFTAHYIHKMDNAYVVSVKFCSSTKIFVSGTSRGEVKLWDNQNYNSIGILNSDQWNPNNILQVIT